MSVNRIGFNTTYSQEMLQNIAGKYHKELDVSNSVNLNDTANVVTIKNALNGSSNAFDTNDPEMKEIQDDLRTNIDNLHVDLSKVSLENQNKSELKLKNFDGTDVNTTNFNSILNTMSLTDEQRSTLNKAMESASDVLNKNQTNVDTYGMRLSQANMEFKYISANLLPEKYQDTFNSTIDKFTKELSDHYVDFEKKMADNLTKTTDPNLIAGGWGKKGQEILTSLENGTDIYQTSTKEYQNLYNKVDVTDKATVKDQLDSVYKDILTKGTSSWWGSDSSSLSSEVKYLADKWNSFMDTLGEKSNMKITTSINYMV